MIQTLFRCLLPALLALAMVSCSSRVPFRMRVLTFNIHHGVGTDGVLDLERVARVIDSVAPDVVALQEVDQGVERSGKVDQLRELARLTGMRALGGGHLEYGGGLYGNGILTHYEDDGVTRIDLPPVEGGEPRVALMARLLPGDPRGPESVTFVATHFDIGESEAHRVESARAITRALIESGGLNDAAVLAGDLNAGYDSETLRILEESWDRTNDDYERPTYPSTGPKRQIDHVLTRPRRRWEVLSTRVLPDAVTSDHRPLLTVLEWPGSTSPPPES